MRKRKGHCLGDEGSLDVVKAFGVVEMELKSKRVRLGHLHDQGSS